MKRVGLFYIKRTLEELAPWEGGLAVVGFSGADSCSFLRGGSSLMLEPAPAGQLVLLACQEIPNKHPPPEFQIMGVALALHVTVTYRNSINFRRRKIYVLVMYEN